MTIHTEKDLDKLFTESVSAYLNRGYIFYAGLFGPAFVKLYNPSTKELIKIQLYKSDFFDRNRGRSIFTTVLSVKQEYACRSCLTLYERTFYVVEKDRAYCDSIEELDAINDLRNARRKRISDNSTRKIALDKIPSNLIDRFMYRINAIKGFKRANASCIKSVSLGKVKQFLTDNPRLRVFITFEYKGNQETISYQI